MRSSKLPPAVGAGNRPNGTALGPTVGQARCARSGSGHGRPDLPALTCLLGIAQRRRRYRGGQHKDGVYDRITWDFVKFH
ncbi:hypothetical protein AB0M34_35025 [Nocardia sp. NPDC050193]